MQRTFKPSMGMWQLDTDDDNILHRIGSDNYTENRHMHVKPEALDDWEELAVGNIPPYTKAEYAAEVERLIAERYSLGKEIEVNRERDTRPERFAEYLAYVGECKARARAALEAEEEQKTDTEVEVEQPEVVGHE